MALTLTFDQPDAGIPAGEVDRGRTDLVTDGFAEAERAYVLMIAVGGVPDGSTADLALLDEPPNSNPLLTQVSPTLWHLEFDKGAWGPFRFRARALSSGSVLSSVTRRCSVRSPRLDLQYPANAERIDPNASNVASAPSVALTEMNEGGTNRSLVDFYRELIERVEAAISDGSIDEPPLFEQLYDDSLEHISGKYRVAAGLQALAALAASSRQLQHGSDFPVAQYTPGGAPLSGANMAQSIRNAYVAAALVGGGTVLIPAGQWSLGSAEIAFTTSHTRDNVKIRGAGMDCTALNLTSPYTGTLFKFSGEASPGHFYTNGGIEDLSINCLTPDAGNTGCAIHIESCINMQFRNVTIRNFTGGTGFKARRVGADGTNQYIQLWNVTCVGSGINFDLQSFVNCQGYGVYSDAAVVRELLCDDVKASIYGGNFQTSAPIAIELAGNGGCHLVMFDFYYEGFAPTLIKLNAPGVSYSTFEVHGLHLGGSPAVLLDVDAFNNVTLTNVYNAGNAGTILKARNGAPVLLVNVADPISLPGKFDLDAASLANLVCIGHAGQQFTGSRFIAARGFGLSSFADGSEPASPLAGDLVRDSTYDRPKVRAVSSWRRLAYVDDDTNELSALLAPHCNDIFDPRIKRLRSVISGGLDALTGSLAGSVISAPASGQRPVWNASDDAFGGQPSFSCAKSGDHFIKGTLAAAIASGSRPGLFVVFRATVAGTDANRRIAVVLESASPGTVLFVGYGDLNDATHPYAYYIAGAGLVTILAGPASLDVFGHCALLTSEPLDSYYLDTNAAVTGADHGNTVNAVDTFRLGGVFDGTSDLGCDVAIAYAAVLKDTLLPEVRQRVVQLARQRFAL